MIRRNSRKPSLESLESRLPFALDLDFDGAGRLLGIAEDSAGQTDGVTLLVTPAGKLNVSDGATDLGTFRVAPNLSVSLGNVTPGFVNLLELDGHTLKTNLRVNLGNQDPDAPPTQFRVLGGTAGSAGTGTIDGSVVARAGTGDQFFVFGELGRALPHVTNIKGSLDIDVGAGGEAGGAPEAVGSVGTPPAPALLNVKGSVHVRNSTVFVIAGSVGGDLILDSTSKEGTIPFLDEPGQLVTLGNFGRPLTVGGSTIVHTGEGQDLISTENATIRGSLFVYSNGGDDTVELGNIDASNDPSNPAFVNAPARVNGDVCLFLGAGDDTLSLGAATETSTVQFRVGGNLFIFGEAGEDTINFTNLRVDRAVIQLDAGAGDDVVNLTHIEAAKANLFALLGDGDDSLLVNSSSSLKLKSLTADGGNGTDTLDRGNLANFSFRKRFTRFA